MGKIYEPKSGALETSCLVGYRQLATSAISLLAA